MKRCLLSTMVCGFLLADRSCLAAVADKGLVNLKDLKQLVSLDLSATQVTDAGLQLYRSGKCTRLYFFPSSHA